MSDPVNSKISLPKVLMTGQDFFWQKEVINE